MFLFPWARLQCIRFNPWQGGSDGVDQPEREPVGAAGPASGEESFSVTA
jgi:hypothetical protein